MPFKELWFSLISRLRSKAIPSQKTFRGAQGHYKQHIFRQNCICITKGEDLSGVLLMMSERKHREIIPRGWGSQSMHCHLHANAQSTLALHMPQQRPCVPLTRIEFNTIPPSFQHLLRTEREASVGGLKSAHVNADMILSTTSYSWVTRHIMQSHYTWIQSICYTMLFLAKQLSLSGSIE